MIFSIGSLMQWSGNRVTDHNRQPMAISVNRIETSTRMANGSMRKYWVADKRTFDISWKDVPSLSDLTVDGYWGGNEMETFYFATNGSFLLTITDGKENLSTYTVVFTDFQKTVSKRGFRADLLDISAKLEEV